MIAKVPQDASLAFWALKSLVLGGAERNGSAAVLVAQTDADADFVLRLVVRWAFTAASCVVILGLCRRLWFK